MKNKATQSYIRNNEEKAGQFERRDFLKMAALGASALVLPGLSTFAGPFAYDEMEHLVPADKKLSKKWMKSLFERGIPEIFSSTENELKYIGMPVGGIACGQLYLGGDGRLWLWHIFKTEYGREKDHEQRFSAMTLGGHYMYPEKTFSRETRPVDQGTVIRITSDNKTISRTLDNKGFDDIKFRGEYPIGRVTYTDAEFPVVVELEAFSPFIPLNVNESSLPATIMSYKITNKTNKKVKVEIAKWLENAVCPYINDPSWGNRSNRLEKQGKLTSIHCNVKHPEKLHSSGETLAEQHGFGSMSLSLLNSEEATVALSVPEETSPKQLFDFLNIAETANKEETKPVGKLFVGAIGKNMELNPGESKTVDFSITWFFPHLNQQQKETGELLALKDIKHLKRHYINRFHSAEEVADYLQDRFEYLAGETRRWNKTWYDSSLPYWLLDRSFIPIDCLATNTMLWFDNGRFWGWEGVECCQGTCQHVWHYTQGMARIFPEIERYLREKVDYGLSFREDGGMGHRDETAGEYGKVVAHDGHCGTIIRTYREHKMSGNMSFLKTNYDKIKRSVEFIIKENKDRDGLLKGEQHNTLDASWFGPMGWISSLYLGALAAGKEMALEIGDTSFAAECDEILNVGRKNIVKELFNGEYFIHKPDTAHPNAINSNDGCHIDQVLGQSLAFQAGISERVIPEKECKSALQSIWKYNYAPDAYIYQKNHKPIKGVRIYATQGEAGTILCTWPKGGDDKAVPGMDKRPEDSPTWLGPGGYFDECMNGFEYQVASHMIYEGMLLEGLAITKSVHERYGAKKRNPYNEIECGDHYSRSMASYGVYHALCGYDYHGAKQQISFNPKINPENFKSAFVTAEGWGSFSQQRQRNIQTNLLELAFGTLRLNQFDVFTDTGKQISGVTVNGRVHNRFSTDTETGKLSVFFDDVVLDANTSLNISITLV